MTQGQSEAPGMEDRDGSPHIADEPSATHDGDDTAPVAPRATTRIRGAAPAGPTPGTSPVGIGTILGKRYLLEHFLGEGEMGVVYRVLDLEVKGEIFAVKILDRGAGDTPESLALLREAVRATRTLRHPNVLAVNSINSDPSGLYLLMEHLEGRSLAAVLETEPGNKLPMDRAWPLIKDMGAALAHAHTDQVIHGDLKPTNVFLNTSGRVVLLDFGLARAVRSAAAEPPEAQSPFASIEMLECRPPEPSDDVYSLACLIYEMLTGRHPYDGLSAIDARAAHLSPRPVESLSAVQNQALFKALALNRSERTSSVNALLVQLDPAGSRAPTRPRWLNPWVLGSAGLAACLIIGVAVWWATTGSTPRVTATAPAPAPTPAPASVPTETDKTQASTPATAPTNQEPSLSFTEPPPPPSEAPATHAESRKTIPVAAAAVSDKATPVESDARPPTHANLPPIVPTPASAAGVNACPYPQEARRMMETGTVILLVRVGADGGVLDTAIDQSSGSEVLDRAAAQCVRDSAHFAPRANHKQAGSYWGRMKFNWSFG